MRILLLTHYFEPENGAPQRRWRALLERFVLAGHEVDVICPPPHYPGGRPAAEHRQSARPGVDVVTEYGAHVHRVSYLRHNGRIASRTIDHLWVSMATVCRGLRLTRREGRRPDVIIATAPGLPTLLAGNALARLLRTPLIAEMRDAWPDLVSYTPGLVKSKGVVGRIKHVVHERVTEMQRQAAHVVATTESFATVLRTRGIADTSVIRNGTDVDRYAVLSQEGGPQPELRVLYMGTLGRSQGLDVAISAAARLRQQGIPIHVRVIGSGADAARLRSLNARLDQPVELLPAIPGSAVYEHYQWADTCLVSLRNWEPFEWTVPSKLYELLATGLHISGAVAGEAAALIRETQSGDVVAPGDDTALAALWEGLAADRARLVVGDSGRRWARDNVDYDRLGERYLEIVSTVVNEAASAPSEPAR